MNFSVFLHEKDIFEKISSSMFILDKYQKSQIIWPGQKLGNRGNHRNHENSSCARELQILPIKNKERQTQKRI